MRKVLAIAFFSVACGGSHKPAESADTASLESSGSSKTEAAEKEKAEPAASAAPENHADSPAPASPAASDTSASPAPARPAPAVTGMIDGKTFNPKVARVLAKAQKDGRVALTLDESHTDCSGAAAAAPGEGVLTMVVPWQNGYKSDLGALKRSTPKKPAGEITFSRARAGGKKDISATFKPAGTVTIIKVATDPSTPGQLKIDLQSGDYMLAGDLDILLCTALK